MSNEKTTSHLAPGSLLSAPSREQIDTIEAFVEVVERRAEEKMLKTGRLEGAHYAAMKQLLRELQERI